MGGLWCACCCSVPGRRHDTQPLREPTPNNARTCQGHATGWTHPIAPARTQMSRQPDWRSPHATRASKGGQATGR
eukprot:7536527-Alexandrium_andersonii.AAC.1